MAQFSNMIIVNSGLDMIAESQAGGKLIFTKAKLGDGQVGETNIQTLTDIISPKLTVNLSNVSKKEAGHVEVRFTVDNTNLDVGFFAREVGIYAKIGEDGTEKLYGYANAGNYTDYLPDKTTPIDAMTVVIDVVVGNASEIGFETDKTLVYLTLADMDDHNADLNAHNDKIASQAEAEAQSNQNNKKFMTPLRVYQAIVAYFTKFLAAAVFTGIVKAVAPGASSNDTSVPTTSWVRTCITSMLKQIAEILEIQWKAEATGYFLFGPYLGNIKILWGNLSFDGTSNTVTGSLNVAINRGLATAIADYSTTPGITAGIAVNNISVANSSITFTTNSTNNAGGFQYILIAL